jgi:hypothetical protein
MARSHFLQEIFVTASVARVGAGSGRGAGIR